MPDGTNNTARFFGPQGIIAAGSGLLYVADSGNQAVRKLALTGTNWAVTTVAGLAGLSGSADGLGTSARFCFPAGLALSATGSFYVGDQGNNALRLGVLVASNDLPAIVSQPQSQAGMPGGNATFSVVATGQATLAYQWRLAATNISGATASVYTRTNLQGGDVGKYSVVVSNGKGSVTSADAQLILMGRPSIVVQPQSQTVALGQGVSFSVTASGNSPLAYQWRCQGSDIAGETAPTFTLPAAWGTNAGAYSVLVTNGMGSAVSADALLSIIALQACGDNYYGQGVAPAVANLIAVAAGAWHSLGLQSDGTVIAWGDNSQGQCSVPSDLTNAVAIAGGGYHSLALRIDSTVAAWGADDYSQTNIPANVTNVIAIAAGTWHSLVLRRDGTVAAWGDDSWGQCSVPPGLSNVVAIAAGGNHSLALQSDATVVAWGENTDASGNFAGQSAVPPGLKSVAGIAAGEYHSLAFLTDGTVTTWGDNSSGQCSVPSALSNVVALAGGGAHSLALQADGTVVAWGDDYYGETSLPPLAADVVAIAAGEAHSLALVRSAQPALQLWLPLRQGQRYSALVQTLFRQSYALEATTTLAGTNWTSLSTNAGNGALRLLTDPSATAPQRFYRVREW